jgi:hypothetical protein
MDVQFQFGGTTYTDIQLSFRDNAASSGDFSGGSTGSIPVASFAGNFTGAVDLKVVLKQFGRFSMMLVLKDNGSGNYSTFEMEWNIVP